MLQNVGFTEMMILLVIALLIFGAKRLPEIGSSMGKGIREFKRSISDTQDAVMRDDTADRKTIDGGNNTGDTTPTSGEPKRLSQ